MKVIGSHELMISMYKATIAAMPVPPAMVEDICMGIVQGGSNALDGKSATLLRGALSVAFVLILPRQLELPLWLLAFPRPLVFKALTDSALLA